MSTGKAGIYIEGNSTIPLTDSSKLSRHYKFFNTYGRECLDGLDRSYFRDLSPAEKAEARNLMVDGFEDSVDAITGLYLLDQMRAIEQFKGALDSPDGRLFQESALSETNSSAIKRASRELLNAISSRENTASEEEIFINLLRQ